MVLIFIIVNYPYFTPMNKMAEESIATMPPEMYTVKAMAQSFPPASETVDTMTKAAIPAMRNRAPMKLQPVARLQQQQKVFSREVMMILRFNENIQMIWRTNSDQLLPLYELDCMNVTEHDHIPYTMGKC